MPTPLREKFCKRRGYLLNKLSQLCGLTGARAAVIVLSITGRLYFSGGSSVEEMEETCFDYVRRDGRAMPPMGLKVKRVKKQRPEIAKIADQGQLRRAFSNRLKTLKKMASNLGKVTKAWAAVVVFPNTGEHRPLCNSSFKDVISNWVQKRHHSCKKEAVLRYVMREILKDISGSGNSGVGAGCDSEVLNDDNFDSRLLAALSDGLLTAPVNSAVANGSSEREPMRSVLVGCEFNRHRSLNLSENNPSVNACAGGHSGVGVGHVDEVFYDNEIHSLYERFKAICLPLLADIETVAGGSFGVESTSTLSDLEGREFVDSLLERLGSRWLLDSAGEHNLPRWKLRRGA